MWNLKKRRESLDEVAVDDDLCNVVVQYLVMGSSSGKGVQRKRIPICVVSWIWFYLLDNKARGL